MAAVSSLGWHLLTFGGGAVVAAATAGWALSNRDKQAAREYALFAGLVSLWCLGAVAQLLLGQSAQYPLAIAIDVTRYFMGIAWFLFAVQYTGYRDRLTTGIWATVAVATGLVLAALVTDPWLGLYYSGSKGITEPFVATTWDLTSFGATGTAYGFVITGLGMLALLYRFAATRYAGEWKVPFLVATMVTSVVADFAVAFPIPGIHPGIDYAAPVTAVNAALYVLVLYRYDVFGFTPIARETIVRNLDEAILVLDPDRRIVDYNAAAESTFGLEGDIGKPARSVVPGPIVDVDPIREGVAGESEASIIRDGRRRHYDVTVSPVENIEADTGLVVTVRDVTDRTEDRRALRRRNERLDEFAGTVAHDLRNPLTVAHTMVADADREFDDYRLTEGLDALDRMDEMIDDLLDLARQGETVEDPESVSLADRAALAWGVSNTGKASLEVVDDRRVRADPDRLGNLLENLFRNAIDHGSEDVTVYVEATEEGFAVEDTGPGIPADERERVFDEGYTTHDEGTGFGLSIVESIAEAHGWSVSVVEGHRSGGARFEFRI